MQVWLNDPVTKVPSVSLSFFALGFVIACIKLLFSGTTLAGFAMGAFSGVDFAAVVGALGTIYIMRKKDSSKESPTE